MPQSFVQLAPDGTGKKMRTRQKTVGANAVQEHYLAFGPDPTWYARTGPQVITAITGKIFFALMNNAGSGQTLRVRKLYIQNAQLVANTGIALEFAVRKITAIAGGTAITPNPVDTNDGALANITCVHTPTAVTEAANQTLYSIYTNSDDIVFGTSTITSSGAFPQHLYPALISAQPEEMKMKEYAIAPGEGVAVLQITAPTTVSGQFDILAVITRDL